MDFLAEPLVAAISAVGVLGLGLIVFVVRDRKKESRKKPTGTNLDDSSGSRQLRPGRSERLLVAGAAITSLAAGLLIGMFSTRILAWFGM